MRIGIDARFYNKETAGISRVIRELLKNLIKIDKKNTYVVFLLKKDLKEFKEKAANVEVVISRAPYYSLAEHHILPGEIRKANLDFIHFLNFNVPFNCPVPYIVTIHDLTLFFFSGRKKKSPIYKLAYKVIMGRAVRKAKFVHAITNYTKKDITKIFKIPEAKIKVIYEGVGKNFRPINSEKDIQKTLKKFKIQKPYLMYHGAWRKHKNLVNLIQAFYRFNKENVGQNFSLVLAGKIDPAYPEVLGTIKNLNLEKHIILTKKFIEDKDLAVLLSGCTAYVFPSLYEGFGLTPLEAMACGAPVLSSDSSCLPEILGDAAYYFDPRDPEDIKTAMLRMCSNKELQQDFSRRSLKQVQKYSWKRMAREIMKLYKKF